jgi:hypothetical protein
MIDQKNIDRNDDEISLKELILKIKEWATYLWSKKLIIILAGIIGGVLGFTYAYHKKPTYKAITTFVLESGGEKGGGLGAYAGLAAMAGIDLGGGGGGIFQGDNILELYKSRAMIEKALLSEVNINGKKELLIEHYIKFNNLRAIWNKKEETKNLVFNRESNRVKDSIIISIINTINKSHLLVTKPDKKLSIISVQVKSENEVFSKLFNEEIVKTVNNFYVETKTKKSLENISILQKQTDSVRNVMNGAIYETVASSDATPNLNPAKQVLRASGLRSQVNVEANKAMYSELIKNLELSKISLRKETPLIQVIDAPIFPLEKERFGKAKGIIIGGFIFSFLTILFLLFKRLLNQILAN